MPHAYYLPVLTVFALAGCATQPQVVTRVVHVPVTQYVQLPTAMTSDCPIAEPQADTVAEAVRVAHERKVSLQQCNGQLAAIRNLEKQQTNGQANAQNSQGR